MELKTAFPTSEFQLDGISIVIWQWVPLPSRTRTGWWWNLGWWHNTKSCETRFRRFTKRATPGGGRMLRIAVESGAVRDMVQNSAVESRYKTDYEGFFISNLRSALQAHTLWSPDCATLWMLKEQRCPSFGFGIDIDEDNKEIKELWSELTGFDPLIFGFWRNALVSPCFTSFAVGHHWEL